MTSIRLAITELRRVTSGRLPRLAVLALVLVPLLYGSLYLFANQDPYARLDHVPAALVMRDTGATGSDGTEQRAGEEVASALERSGAFEWHRVGAEEAESGVRDGRYTFSLTVAPDFSQALLSAEEFQPRQGMITVSTNDANNYLVGTIADKLVGEIHESIAAEVGTKAADRFLLGFDTIFGRTRQAADGATQLAAGAGQARDGATRLADGAHDLLDGQRALADGAQRLDVGAAELSDGLNTLRDKTTGLPTQTARLADGAQQVADGTARLAQEGSQFAALSDQLAGQLDAVRGGAAQRLRALGLTDQQVQDVLATLDQAGAPVQDANARMRNASGQLTQLADGARQVSVGARQLANASPALAEGIGSAATGAAKLDSGADQLVSGENRAVDGTAELAGGADRLRDGIRQVADGGNSLRDGLTNGLNQIPHPDDPTRAATAQTIGNPVGINTVGDVKAGSYGAGLAPFFLSLATWIGAFVLFLLLRPLSSRALAAGQSPLRVAIGGWLPAAALGLAQILLMFTVVATVVGIDVHRPVATLGLLALASLTFTAILHALNAAFGAVGKFLGLVLLIMQLISAGGTFPWQTLPDALYPLHEALPMGYLVDGLRQLIYGGSMSSVGLDVAVLLAYLVGALAVSTVAAARQRVWTPSRLKPELTL